MLWKQTQAIVRNYKDAVQNHTFILSTTAGLIAGILGGCLHAADRQGLIDLESLLPNLLVFQGFMVFAALVASFRTAHALVRYTDASELLHQMHALWFDGASTVFAFGRASSAGRDKVDLFQHTLVRLLSCLNAMCFEELTIPSLAGTQNARDSFMFEVIDLHSLDMKTQELMFGASFGPEFVFQSVQQLIVDAMSNTSDGTEPVLIIPPPILTRSFQELGSGLLAYHEARKLAKIPLPTAYQLVTYMILVTEAIFAPFTLAMETRGIMSSFVFTFFATFLLWFLNGMAETLTNPFQKTAQALEMDQMQLEFNAQLIQLLEQSGHPLPKVRRRGSKLSHELEDFTLIDAHPLAEWKEAVAQRATDGVCPQSSQDLPSSTGIVHLARDDRVVLRRQHSHVASVTLYNAPANASKALMARLKTRAPSREDRIACATQENHIRLSTGTSSTGPFGTDVGVPASGSETDIGSEGGGIRSLTPDANCPSPFASCGVASTVMGSASPGSGPDVNVGGLPLGPGHRGRKEEQSHGV